MVSFEQFTMADGVPIYLQIIGHIKRGVVAGSIRNGDEMPSRRVLSALLGVNPNTVQKAYRMLEEEGLITSHAGAKSYVSADDTRIGRIRAELLVEIARGPVAALRQMGVERADMLELMARLWDDAEQEGAQ